MRLLRRIVTALLVLVLVALVGGYWYERPLLLTATGYAAHNACAVELVAGRANPESDLPPNPLVPVLRTSTEAVGTDPHSRGSIWGVLAAQKAHFTEGFGCTVAEERPDLPTPTAVQAGANPFTDAATPTAGPEIQAALAAAFGDSLSESEREELGTRAVLVLRKGELVAERYAEGFDAETPQLGWSMTKSVTNLMVGRLVLAGEVSLDEKELLSAWADDERRDITVDHLLRMTSGLAWDETYDLGTPITQMLYREPDMGAFVAGQEAAHPTGTYQQYSSGSHTLLCQILAERVGSGANLPREQIFAPLGLSSAVLEPDGVGTPVCSSYMWATPRDWAALGQFALQDGVWNGERLLPAGWLAESTVAFDGETEDVGYAAGWWVNRLPDGSLAHPELPEDAYFAQGHDGQWIVIVPSADLVVVRLGFSPSVDDEGVIELTRTLLADN
jgi:CubicO group peptidase (beta-lactamase class C family)